ncbi:BRO-N domain-containing protein [Desulfococcus multivorans]|uniref:Prophage antirepressor n=2 Tax=Desulfococcus multivorans TaxID=897 RepID=S7T7E6_DESML|nr:BRO family protein [Desulfococcus multivorans]AQV02588.1 hypothetical protein B2D07_18615 [Desulfococcus multivorans]EPR32511.1 prophage antirepressor [Desulfococcus multivorans DSM 2059]SKA27666.1 BRO family, N-terminal domain [Desulfococcus multivorans DSM 2059]
MSGLLKSIFQFNGHDLTAITGEDGQPWFVGNEVAKILGYADAKQAVRMHFKYPKMLKGVESTPLTSSPRGITIIPESNLYRLITRSKLPSAEKFEDWITEVVLPTIRKTGVILPPHRLRTPNTRGKLGTSKW